MKAWMGCGFIDASGCLGDGRVMDLQSRRILGGIQSDLFVVGHMVLGELNYTVSVDGDAPPPPIITAKISWWRGSSGAAPKGARHKFYR